MRNVSLPLFGVINTGRRTLVDLRRRFQQAKTKDTDRVLPTTRSTGPATALASVGGLARTLIVR